MAATVDFRRFRTWDAEPALAPQPTWRILVRYGYLRLASGWAGRSLLILLTLVAVVSVGGISYAFAGGAGVDAFGWVAAFAVYLYPLAAILLMVAAPLFAEDLRFNAPLFYFSKPLRASDYFLGKLAFLASLIGVAVVVPMVVLMLLALVVGVPAGTPPAPGRPGYYQSPDPATVAQVQAEWHASHIDSVTKWAAAVGATVPGMLLVIALFTALAVACSVYTQRGWHAGMAFVAIVGGTGLAGNVLSNAVPGALGSLSNPIGWTYLLVDLPMRLMYPPPGGSSFYEAQATRDAGLAIPLAFLFTAATTVLALWVSHRRLSREEGRL
ncbi:MAG: hypothetical protein ACYDBQ_09345 [Thermoplasmatota archaeon]